MHGRTYFIQTAIWNLEPMVWFSQYYSIIRIKSYALIKKNIANEIRGKTELKLTSSFHLCISVPFWNSNKYLRISAHSCNWNLKIHFIIEIFATIIIVFYFLPFDLVVICWLLLKKSLTIILEKRGFCIHAKDFPSAVSFILSFLMIFFIIVLACTKTYLYSIFLVIIPNSISLAEWRLWNILFYFVNLCNKTCMKFLSC